MRADSRDYVKPLTLKQRTDALKLAAEFLVDAASNERGPGSDPAVANALTEAANVLLAEIDRAQRNAAIGL